MKRILILCLTLAGSAVHAGVSEAQAVKAIIGEAGNQSFTTMTAVASAIRNRGSLQGVYGVGNPCVNKASARLKAMALKAWRASAVKSTVGRLRYFGCAADAPYFASIGLRPALRSGAITFYK
jgi:hypothetical protein